MKPISRPMSVERAWRGGRRWQGQPEIALGPCKFWKVSRRPLRPQICRSPPVPWLSSCPCQGNAERLSKQGHPYLYHVTVLPVLLLRFPCPPEHTLVHPGLFLSRVSQSPRPRKDNYQPGSAHWARTEQIRIGINRSPSYQERNKTYTDEEA